MSDVVFPPHVCIGSEQRCCGRKPLPYKRDKRWFCVRCARAYQMPSGEQIENFLWLPVEGGFAPRYPTQDYTTFPGADAR